MIFIGGIQPKTRIIEGQARPCPLCGRIRAHYRRVDHYLSFFFIPVLRIKKGEPFLACDTCQQEVQEMVQSGEIVAAAPAAACSQCGRRLESDYDFCPGCGRRVDPR